MISNPTTTLPRLNIGTQSTINMTGGTDYTSMFQPETITEEQYISGGVDFYTQTLGTGIQSTVSNEDESKDDIEKETGPNIFKPIGADGPQDIGRTALQNALKGGLTNVTLYNEGQLNPAAISFDKLGNVTTPEYKASYGVDQKTGKTTLKGKGDLVSDFFSNFSNNVKTSGSQQITNVFDMASAPTLTGPAGKARAVGLPGAVSTALSISGLGMFSGLASLGGAANMAIQQQNAARIKATGGGAFMDVNNMMVSRAPGSFTYSGNLQGMSQMQMRSLEAIRRGYLPGSLQLEEYDPTTGRWGEATGKKAMFDMSGSEMAAQGGAYNPETGGWISVDGSRSAGGSKEQAQSLADKVNSMFKSDVMGWRDVNAIRSTLDTNIFGNLKEGARTFQDAYTKEAIDRAEKTTGLNSRQLVDVVTGRDFVVRGNPNEGGMNDRGYSTFSDFRGSSEDAPDVRDPMSKEVQAEIERAIREQTSGGGDNQRDGSDRGGGRGDDSDRGGAGRTGGSGSGDVGGATGTDTSGWGGPDDLKFGGRVGYQEGGAAGFAQRPEFVGGKQSQPDGVSIADDQPRDVQEGTFVINAAAADFAGRDDIEKMLRKAYQKAGGAGQSGVSQEVQIAVSKGEVLIPPHIAKIIGYDRLNKINNRGKKEIARRQEAAGGGFIDRKKFAKGDKVTVYRGEPLDPDKAPYTTDYGYGKENVGKFHSPSIAKARNYTESAGSGNRVIRSRKVTIDELFDGVKEAWKVRSKQENEYFSKMSKADLNKNLKYVDTLKKAYQSGERSLEEMAHFLQEQVFHEGKSKINFIETLKNDPKSAGKLAGRAIAKAATVATPPVAFLMGAAEVLTPSKLSKGTMFDDSFMTYTYTYNK